jgi:hypothetical protein
MNFVYGVTCEEWVKLQGYRFVVWEKYVYRTESLGMMAHQRGGALGICQCPSCPVQHQHPYYLLLELLAEVRMKIVEYHADERVRACEN